MNTQEPMMNQHLFPKSFLALLTRVSMGLVSAAGAAVLLWPGISAAATDLASDPIASSQTSAAKPNIMVLMDTSFSMQATHMPDDLEKYNENAQRVGYASPQCNALYYDPNTVYVLPKIVDTTDAALPLVDAPTPDFNAARYAFYDATDLSVVDLGASFQAWDSKTRLGPGAGGSTPVTRSDTPQAAYYHVYTKAALTPKLNYAGAECNKAGLGGINGGTWTKVIVPAGQRANFAIWYTYYRTRMALVKSGIGRAFAGVDNKYRVGFISASPLQENADPGLPPAMGAPVVASKYQPIADFDATQRNAVYTKLYAQKPSGASPMREGLARVGRHFSDDGVTPRNWGLNNGMPEDPVQYSCQRNYTIMTTDGYWNKGFETVGPVKMDGTTLVGQQDGVLTPGVDYTPRPIFDGGSSGSYIEKRQRYDYQVVDCSSGSFTKVVTSHTRAVNQYFKQTKSQYRSTATLKQKITRTTKTTTKQTVTVEQLKEKVTKDVKSVTHSTRRDTVTTRQTDNMRKKVTRVERNDKQQSIKYQYVKKTEKTATMVKRTRTVTTTQYTRIRIDNGQSEPCSDPKADGCSLTTNTTVPVDPDNCSPQAPTFDNDFRTVTCSDVTTAAGVAAKPNSVACNANNGVDVLLAGPVRREKCTTTTKISYVYYKDAGTKGCSAVDNATTWRTCGPVITPVLSAGPASGDSVASCNPLNSTNTNLVVPPDATEPLASNSYTVLCPTTAVLAPGGVAEINATTHSYAVDPSTCAVTSWSPLTAKTHDLGGGLSMTCTPVVLSNVAVAYNPSAVDVAPAAPDWKTTTYTTTSVGPNNVDTRSDTCDTTGGVAGPGYLSRKVTDSGSSPYTRTTCTLVSDTGNYAVNTNGCGTGATYSGGTVTSACTTTAPVTTDVASCSAVTTGYNSGTGDTTSCGAVEVSDGPVASCTHGSPGDPAWTDPSTHYTYSCESETEDKNVNVGSCSPGDVTLPVAPDWKKTTCNAATSKSKYVQEGDCTDVPAGKTVVACTVDVVQAEATVAPGACTAGTHFTEGDFGDPLPAGQTETCTSSSSGWVQEAVGTACPGVAPGTPPAAPAGGTGWTYLEYTDGSSVKNVCAIQDTGVQSQNTTSCTPSAPMDLTQVSCSNSVVSAAAPAPTCSTSFYESPEGSGNWFQQVCTDTAAAPTTESSCTPVDTPVAPNYTTVSCTPIMDSWKLQARRQDETWTQNLSGNAPIGAPTGPVLGPLVGPTDASACMVNDAVTPKPVDPVPSVTAQDGIPATHPAYGATPLDASSPVGHGGVIAPNGLMSNDLIAVAPVPPDTVVTYTTTANGACVTWPCRIYTVVSNTGSSNSLADVAQYYYVTDLRPGLANDLAAPLSSTVEDDRAPHQHMTTFVVGLGVSGSLVFDKNYRNPATVTGDFADIRTGVKSWPVWPTLAVEAGGPLGFINPFSIDDFWHAAVNGRGEYFSAADAYTMVSGLQGALSSINAALGAGAGATSTTATPTAGDSGMFVPGFKKGVWTGDVQSMAFDLTTKTVINTGDSWSAQAILESKVDLASDSRRVVVRTAAGETDGAISAGDKLTNFLFGNLSAGRQANFGAAKVATWTQFPAMTAAQQSAAEGASLVNFLRGQRGKEDFAPGDVNRLYRKRERVLGDIVGSQPVYVKEPGSQYTDAGYAAFKAGAALTRSKMVYVGANDGMLHAFYAPKPGDANWADRGKEAWAYIPSPVLPELHKLADAQYSSNHRFFVDGTVTVGDAYFSGGWHTILVGGLNAGGKGYYALDVTNPEAPKSLWEFTTADDVNLGYSFGRPIISKLADGTWVVMVTSGYNNADGKGYLYILKASDGSVVEALSTGDGSPADPSGLREINNWVSNGAMDNTSQRVYGGDLHGNVWRFNINDTPRTVVNLATLKTTGGSPTAQPITTRIELAEIGSDPYLFVGTGKLLGASDLTDTQQQSVYSFKDIGSTYPGGDVRPFLKPMSFTAVASTPPTRTLACSGTAAQCAQKTAWVIDLPEAGERMNVDFQSGKGTLVFMTNVPASNICSAGHAWVNYVDQVSGEQVAGFPNGGVTTSGNALGVGMGLVLLPDGSLWLNYINADASMGGMGPPWGSPPPAGKRISWREVIAP